MKKKKEEKAEKQKKDLLRAFHQDTQLYIAHSTLQWKILSETV